MEDELLEGLPKEMRDRIRSTVGEDPAFIEIEQFGSSREAYVEAPTRYFVEAIVGRSYVRMTFEDRSGEHTTSVRLRDIKSVELHEGRGSSIAVDGAEGIYSTGVGEGAARAIIAAGHG